MQESNGFYKDKRVLVTGGAGFIGSHLVEKLVACGAHVTVLDNFSSGSLNNLKNVLANITLFYADICSVHSVMKATHNQDAVFHLAALTSVQASVDNPELCRKINVLGTQQLLDASRQNGVTSFVFSSSCAVYGSRSVQCHEDDTPYPESPYAASKLEGEKLCKTYAIEHGMNTAILRYFNVFGPRQSHKSQYATVVATFTHNLLTGKPITIFGDGKQTRDFIEVGDVVAANLTVGASTACPGDIFNIGTGKSMSLLDLIEHLEQKLNTKRSSISFQPARQGDITYSAADCVKYANFLQQLDERP